MKFNAKAVLLMHEFEKEVEITSIDDIRSYFSPYEGEVTQVNLSKYKKIYYCSQFLANSGVNAKVIDKDDETFYMAFPLLLVQCDDSQPVDITEDTLSNIKDAIDFC